jgi:hypothetical protein
MFVSPMTDAEFTRTIEQALSNGAAGVSISMRDESRGGRCSGSVGANETRCAYVPSRRGVF